MGKGTFNLAVSAATNTIYAANSGLMNFNGDTVSVINGASCDGTSHSGCGHLAAIAKVGLGPAGITVNDRTHTVYVANNANGDSPGTVSVINGATCNGTHTAGCHRRFPAMATGVAPLQIAADTRTDILYVTDFGSAAVTILNGARCNATVTSGCGAAPGKQRPAHSRLALPSTRAPTPSTSRNSSKPARCLYSGPPATSQIWAQSPGQRAPAAELAPEHVHPRLAR